MTSTRTGDLRFHGPIFSHTGFTSAGISAYGDLHPPAVVRELVQNAIDAGTEADVGKTIVRFRLHSAPRDRIPGMEAYRRAFRAALEHHRDGGGKLPGQARIVTDRIKRALDSDHLDVLSITDNGIGLDPRRMTAILSDGVSVKGEGAAGAFGNGHFTAVPASDLRYILYGGVRHDGTRISSGHAHLASHPEPDGEHFRGAGGVYIRDFNTTAQPDTEPYDYVSGTEVPSLVGEELDRIESAGGHGSAVLITAFNNFLEKSGGSDTLWNMIATAVAANFFVALVEETLEVQVEDVRPGNENNGDIHVLNSETTEKVLEGVKDRKRAAKRGFIAGASAFAAYSVYSKAGTPRDISTRGGKIHAYLDKVSDGPSRVDLCRNGMWITNNIPGFRGRFADRVPFHMVLTLDADSGGELYDLIRQAEGPLHNSIELKTLGGNDGNRCRDILGEIWDWIERNTETIKSDSYTLDDFLAIDFDGDGTGGVGRTRRGYDGAPVIVTSKPSRSLMTQELERGHPGAPGTGPGKRTAPNANRSRKRPALPALFRAVSCPVGNRRHLIRLECQKDIANAELRLVPDEGIDATCDRPNQDPYTPATLANVTIDGTNVPGGNLRSLDGRKVGVALGDLARGTSLTIEADYSLEGDFADLPAPALRIELVNSPPEDTVDGHA